MATDEIAPGVSGEQPVIVDLELGEIRFTAHRELEAIEVVLVDPTGAGVRSWIGCDVAATTALQHVGAVLRLISGDPT